MKITLNKNNINAEEDDNIISMFSMKLPSGGDADASNDATDDATDDTTDDTTDDPSNDATADATDDTSNDASNDADAIGGSIVQSINICIGGSAASKDKSTISDIKKDSGLSAHSVASLLHAYT